MTKDIEREALIAEIDHFINEAKKSYIVERWAVTYENSNPFSHTINDKNEVWWMKTQARQLWDFWQAAKAHDAEKLKGCAVVPVESIEAALLWMDEDIDAHHMSNEGFDKLFEHKPILEKILLEATRGGK